MVFFFFFPSARKCADRRVNVARHSLGLKTIFVCIIIIIIIYYYKRITSTTDAIASYILDCYYLINYPAVHLYALQTIYIVYIIYLISISFGQNAMSFIQYIVTKLLLLLLVSKPKL